MAENKDLIISSEFKAKVKSFNEDFYQKYNEISREPTPQVDGEGRKIIEKRPDGHDYIVESYMRDCLDRHFPGWSWEAASPLQFLGSEWVVAQGHLIILDYHLLEFGINPPVRKFFGVDSVRIQYKRDSEHLPINIIDVGDNCKSANTAAMKYAINRLTHIGDDVYGKRMEYDGSGSYEDVVMATGDFTSFGHWIEKQHISWGEVKEILKVKELTEVKDWTEAIVKIKEAKGIK